MFRLRFSVVALFCVGIAVFSGLVAGCGPDSNTTYRDFLDGAGTVLQADSKTAAPGLVLSAYNWIVTFTDGSTVSVPSLPTNELKTNSQGKFNFSSSQLELKSGTLAQVCTDVCVEHAIGYEDVCIDWEISYEDYCAATDTDENGNEYCTDPETTPVEYCANWITEPYQYCAVEGQDCGYLYPSRNIADIVSAYAEITYADGLNQVTTQSEGVTFPAQAIQKKNVTSDTDTIVNSHWVQNDVFISSLTAKMPAAALVKAQTRKMMRTGTPHFGRSHPPATVIASDELDTRLTTIQKEKLLNVRSKCNAYPKQ